MFRRILVPHDFSPHADAALDLAIELAGPSKARIHLMHLFQIPMEMLSPYEIPMPPALAEKVRAAASERLEAALARVRAAGLEGDAEVDSGRAAEMIVERAAALVPAFAAADDGGGPSVVKILWVGEYPAPSALQAPNW